MRILGLLLGLSACVVVPVPLPVMTISQPQVRTLAANVAPDAGFDASFQAVRRTPIRYNAQLGAIAKAHAADMEARNYFDHASPEGLRARDRAAARGIPGCGIGENIGQGQKSSAEVFAAWMNSAPHRKNMLDPRMASYGFAGVGESWVLVFYAPC